MTRLKSSLNRAWQALSAAAAGTELVTGVVDAKGSRATSEGPDRPWTLRFTLDSWRRGAAGSLRRTPLHVERRISRAEAETFSARIWAYQVIAARVRFAGPDAAEFEELVYGVEDDALAARGAQLAARPPRQDARFGTLALDPRYATYNGRTEWSGAPVRLQLIASEDESLDAALRTAHALWDDQARWSARIRDCAVQQLLPDKNEDWLDDDESPLTPEEFTARMPLESITVQPDGAFTFWHRDEDLFTGLNVIVSGTLADGPTRAEIPG